MSERFNFDDFMVGLFFLSFSGWLALGFHWIGVFKMLGWAVIGILVLIESFLIGKFIRVNKNKLRGKSYE